MSSLTFLNPAYLGALTLAAIPILVHLIRRRKVRIIPWAAWDFLLESSRRRRRQLHIEQLILLLLRIAIVCLIVFAFSRPILRTLGLPLIATDAHVHALIVIDNSLSMGFERGGMTDFERARQIAEKLINKVLKQGDTVSLVLLSAQPTPLLREPTFDLQKALERVRATQLSDLGTDYAATAELCAQLLKNVPTPTREVYWITDSQRTGFGAADILKGDESARQRVREAFRNLATQGRITWISLQTGERENIAVDTPRFSRELITPQAPVRMEAVVRNYSNKPQKGLLLHLMVDEQAVGSTRVDVPAKGQAVARFIYLFDKPGIHTGKIALGKSDGLSRDNTAYFTIKVRERLKVLIVNPRPSPDPVHDEAFYLATALAPSGASQGGSTAIQPTVHSSPRLSGLNLRTYDVVVVTGLVEFTPEDRRALEDFVRSGGGLLLFPGPMTDSSRTNSSWGLPSSASPLPTTERGESLLPMRLGARHVLSEEQALHLNPATIHHPVLMTFQDTTEVNLNTARFTLIYDLLPLDTARERTNSPNLYAILCRFTGGQPALVEGRFGQGKVILAAMTAGATGGDFPYKPAYVPFIHQLVAYLAADPATSRNLHVGDPLTARFEVTRSQKPLRLTDPTGYMTLQNAVLNPEGLIFTYTNTHRAGIYRLGFGEDKMVDAFAVNPSAEESNLALADEAQVRATIGPAPFHFAYAVEDLQAIIQRSRRGMEVWRSLVLAVLPLLFLEALLAQRFGRRG
jgi:hypothetical protein